MTKKISAVAAIARNAAKMGDTTLTTTRDGLRERLEILDEQARTLTVQRRTARKRYALLCAECDKRGLRQ